MILSPLRHRADTLTIPGLALLLTLGSAVTPSMSADVPGLDELGGLVRKQFDHDSNDQISNAEWLTGIGDSFEDLDSDGDGGLTSSELDQLAEPIRDEFGDFGAILISALVKSAIVAFDSDKDQSVSRSEYDDGSSKVFSGLDTNGDNLVTEAELKNLPGILLNSAK